MAGKPSKKSRTPFFMLERRMVQSTGYRSLSATARLVLVELMAQNNGKNNGDLSATRTMAREWGIGSPVTLQKALAELENAGWIIQTRSSLFSSTIESMVFDAQSLSDAVSGLAEGMARSVVNALGEMAAQWVAYHAVQLMLGKSSETTAVASAAVAGTSIAAAYAPAAAMASLASFGANAVPAMAGITSTVGLSQTMALAGMAHDGIDSVPREGTWLLDKGERVVDQRTNADLKNFLSSEGRSSAPPNIQIINNGDPVSAKAEMDGDTLRIILDRVQSDFIGSLQNDGRYSKAIANTYGLRRSGL